MVREGRSDMNSVELFKRSLKVSPGGVQSPVRAFKSVGGQPIFFKEAKGAHLRSVEGAEFIDFCQSFGPLILGHRDPEVAQAVESMMHKAWTFGACEPYSLELAEYIVDKISHVDSVRFVNSGTEAVMSALRVARAATGRNKILKFEGCYHGHVDSLLVKAGSGLAGEAASDSAGVSAQVASETLIAPLGDSQKVEDIFQSHGSEIAAIIVEPLPANFGLLKQKTEFLHFLRQISSQHGTLLIFDEVISGFRIAFGGMAEALSIDPDLVTYGKVMGGGFPVGCYGGKQEYMSLVAPLGPVYQAGTLSGNPVGMVAGLATLKKVYEQNIIPQLNARTEQLVGAIRDLITEFAIPMKLSCQGSLMWFHNSAKEDPESLADIPSNHSENFYNFFHQCVEEGIYLAPSAYEVGFMSWAHDEKIMVETILRYRKIFQALKGK